MATTAKRPRLIFAAIVTALAVINAMALWGEAAAYRIEAILQLSTGIGAVACGIVVSRRMSGSARWWRLFFAAGLACWLIGQVLWWTSARGVPPFAASVAYLAAPVLAAVAMVLFCPFQRRGDRTEEEPGTGAADRQCPRRGRRRFVVHDPGGYGWFLHRLDCIASPVGRSGRRARRSCCSRCSSWRRWWSSR